MTIAVSLPDQHQSPIAKLDYSFDWNDGSPSGLISPETVAISLWTVVHETGPASEVPVLSNDAIDVLGFITAVWITGGLENSVWKIQNKITTSAGRIDTRAFLLYILSS